MDVVKRLYHSFITPYQILLFASIVVIFVGLQFVLSSWILFSGDVFYNEDIARDLLLLEHIVTSQPITLIGPRISVIGGLYHGPLWLYLNVPAYVIGHGNPVALGVFWQLLYLIVLGITFFIAKKLFGTTVGLLSLLLTSVAGYLSVLNNTYGAVLFFPLYFYCFVRYIKSQNVADLLIAFFLGGLLIQSEIAFGAPILAISILYICVFLYKTHKLHHLLSLIIVLIPLGTYIAFDVRHGFLQAHAIIQYATSHKPQNLKGSYISFVLEHFSLIRTSSLAMITYGSTILTVLVVGIFLYTLVVSRKGKKDEYPIYVFFLLLYGGFWIVSLLYKDGMWVWYYNEFTPVIVILFCSTVQFVNKYVFIATFLLLYLTCAQHKLMQFYNDTHTFVGKSAYSWQVYNTVANTVYKNAQNTFGYYINEHDSLGYRTRYAMHYIGRSYSKKGNENVKLASTYLIMEKYLDNLWWKKERVHLTKKPVKQTIIDNLYIIEEYYLNNADIATPSDPNLINSLIFR